MHTLVGKGKYQKSHLDLSRNHTPIDATSKEEDLRKTKNGYIFHEKRIKRFIKGTLNHPDEIISGSPVTRCLGDKRYK